MPLTDQFRTPPVVSRPGLPSGRDGKLGLFVGARDAMILGSGDFVYCSMGTKPLFDVLFHSGFLPATVLGGRARRCPSLSPLLHHARTTAQCSAASRKAAKLQWVGRTGR